MSLPASVVTSYDAASIWRKLALGASPGSIGSLSFLEIITINGIHSNGVLFAIFLLISLVLLQRWSLPCARPLKDACCGRPGSCISGSGCGVRCFRDCGRHSSLHLCPWNSRSRFQKVYSLEELGLVLLKRRNLGFQPVALLSLHISNKTPSVIKHASLKTTFEQCRQLLRPHMVVHPTLLH